MAHHSEHAPSDLELDAISEGLGLGATGQFPDGSIDEMDEGEIQMGVTVKDGTVVVAFGKKVSWVGFTGPQTIDFANLLIQRAQEAMNPDAEKLRNELTELTRKINDAETDKLKQAGNLELRPMDATA